MGGRGREEEEGRIDKDDIGKYVHHKDMWELHHQLETHRQHHIT